MKIYTKTGDAGETGLYGGTRVSKTDARVEAYGTVDEVNAFLGIARSHASDKQIDGTLESVQNALFDLGADLATPFDAKARGRITPVGADDVAWLEEQIDRYDADLSPLESFILPGGNPMAAALHAARAVARRAERRVVAMEDHHEVNPHVRIYLNRLSDLLFVLSRIANMQDGVSESAWRVRGRGDRNHER